MLLFECSCSTSLLGKDIKRIKKDLTASIFIPRYNPRWPTSLRQYARMLGCLSPLTPRPPPQHNLLSVPILNPFTVYHTSHCIAFHIWPLTFHHITLTRTLLQLFSNWGLGINGGPWNFSSMIAWIQHSSNVNRNTDIVNVCVPQICLRCTQ